MSKSDERSIACYFQETWSSFEALNFAGDGLPGVADLCLGYTEHMGLRCQDLNGLLQPFAFQLAVWGRRAAFGEARRRTLGEPLGRRWRHADSRRAAHRFCFHEANATDSKLVELRRLVSLFSFRKWS